jgi:predicted CxxxxCH...CXXCH cytochrome family protein
MIGYGSYFRWGSFLALIAVSAFLLVSGCGDESQSPQVTATGASNVAATKTLPLHGKVRLASAPANPVFGMIWIDTTKSREYIYDGAQWVPHDSSVDAFYKTIAVSKITLSMIQDEVCLDGDPACTPTGAHGGPGTAPAGHYAFSCLVCHKVGGRLVFDKNGPAYAAGKPAPTFDATAKTCSNIACHGVAPATFSYYTIDGSGEPVLTTVNIYGNSAGVTPSWYSTGAAACGACHGNPPRNGTDGSNVWHSGYHGGQGPTGAYNQCQFCHLDASGSGGQGTTITNPSLHSNGIINVQANFTSKCFNCH